MRPKKYPTFKAKPGQVDYTHARWAPVINCVVQNGSKFLIVKRNSSMRLYPGYWNGIAGFLDDRKTLEEKVKEELCEEAGIKASDILSIKLGEIFDLDDPKYRKTWIVHPVLVKVKHRKIRLDWEAEEYRWISAKEIKRFKITPNFEKVLKALFTPTPIA